MNNGVPSRPLPQRALPPLTARKKETLANASTNRLSVQGFDKETASNTELNSGVLDEANELKVSVQSKRARTRRHQANKSKSLRSVDVVTNKEHALTSILSEDDVVAVDHIDNLTSMTTLPGIAGNGVNSKPQETVYIQTTSGFTTHTNEWLANRQTAVDRRNMQSDNEASLITRTTQVALSFHGAFIFFALLLHGILAGVAIWNVVLAFALSATGEDNFFLQYSPLAQPTQTTFHILLILCLLSSMDRFNFAKPGRNVFMRLIKVEPGSWTVVAYFLAFLFNVGLSGLDYWLGRISTEVLYNQTIVDAYPNASTATTLTTWHVINVLRAVLVLIGWLLIAIRPNEDDTAKSIFS